VRKIRVLVVDDSLTVRAMLEQVLGKDPEISVIGTAIDAEEAWRIVVAENPDVLTLDIEMPGLDGLRFLSDVMARHPTPVVMISGSTAPGCEQRAEAMRRGAAGCFAKDHIVSCSGLLIKTVKDAARHGRLGGRAAA
jgi:two-component system chemotaxis response regulator CheB